MSELNFKPAAGGGLAGDRSVAVPTLDAGALAGGGSRAAVQSRQQRRRLSSTRFQLEDGGFRLFRVF